MSATLLWFRLDLRLADHQALTAALARGLPVVPVFIWAPEEEAPWAPGAASRWWLHQSLARLTAALKGRGSDLVLRRGPSLPALTALARETGADRVHCSRRVEPAALARDAAVASGLAAEGLALESFGGVTLFEPGDVRTRAGGPYQVFTPFWKACRARPAPAQVLPAPRSIPAPDRWPASAPLASLGLEPAVDWAAGLRAAWTPGEAGASERLASFLLEGASEYPAGRDRMDSPATSRLSPHLHFGEISARQVFHAARALEAQGGMPGAARGAEKFLSELGWREFAHHLLVHFPATTDAPLRPEFARFPWRTDTAGLRAWQRGRTGFPVVDAGMRELWSCGWMHNRARMIVASFLVKDLLLPWQAGARWFWDTLVDADLASNTLGWQWVAGCGADAAPYFRVFNPVSQGRKFDGAGHYVRRWVPELARLDAGAIHAPWEALPMELAAAGVSLGDGYPMPMVDHAEARERALAALASIRRG